VSQGIIYLEKGKYMDALCCFQIVAQRQSGPISSDTVNAYYQLARLREIVENHSLEVMKMYPSDQTAQYWYTRAATNGHLGALRVLLEPKLQDYIKRNGSFFRAMLNSDERNAAQALIQKLHGLDSNRAFSKEEIEILLSDKQGKDDLGKIVKQFPWVFRKIMTNTSWEPENPAVSSSSMNGNRH
jgi:hypothetical protein